MRKNYFLSIGLIAGLLIFMSLKAHAQSSDLRKTEIGAFLTSLNMRDSVREEPLGFGGRVSYNMTKNFAVDGELAYYPQDPSNNFGETQGLIGLKAEGRSFCQSQTRIC